MNKTIGGNPPRVRKTSDCLTIIRATHLLFFVRTIFCYNAEILLPLWRYPLTEAPGRKGGDDIHMTKAFTALCA